VNRHCTTLQANAVRLFYNDGMGYKAIAKMLELSERVVATILYQPEFYREVETQIVKRSLTGQRRGKYSKKRL
jgi:DNA-binding transcriptional regulator LsrR (DeoR family)